MGDSIDLERYFVRIGYRGPREPTVNVLHALTGAHTQSIPFENIDALLGHPIRLEPEVLYRKLVLGGRGGYCFEQNGLFMAMLTRLGFEVRPLRAAVRLGESDRRVAVGHTHLALEVRIDDQFWVTDVGVGSASLTRALRFTAGLEQSTPHETRRLIQENKKWFHQVRHGDTWVDVYEFSGETMPFPDRLIANWYTHTYPDSKFCRELIVARALPDGRRVSLHNYELTLRKADGATEKQTLANLDSLLDALREHFGISLLKGARFDLQKCKMGQAKTYQPRRVGLEMDRLRSKPDMVVSGLWAFGVAVLLWYVSHGKWTVVPVGALIGYLFAQVLHLRKVVIRLLERQEPVGQKTRPAKAPPAPVRRKAPTAPAETTPPPRAVTTPDEPKAPPPEPKPRVTAKAPKPEWPVSYPSVAALDDRLTGYAEQGLGWLQGGNPLARVGIVVLFFGAAFLAKYSVDQGLFPVEARFAALGLGAIFLTLLGWRLRKRRPVFAQLLQGGGIAGFYLTVFAARQLFELLPVSLALGLMIAVAAASAVLAVAQEALALAFLGTVGGFAAPLLVATGSADPVALFTYYTVLNLAVFAIAWVRAWRVLNLAGFVFTFSVSGLFRATGYTEADLVSTDCFLLLFFVLYVGISIAFSLRQKSELKGYVSGSLVFGLPVVVFSLHASLVAQIEYALAWSALGFGLFYGTGAWILYASRRENLRLLCEAFAALAVIFASLAIPLAFDRETTIALWALEGAGLLWLGVRQQRLPARAFGALLQGGGGLGYLVGFDGGLPGGPAVLNSATVGALMLALGGLASGYWLYRARARLTRYETQASLVAGLWGIGWWLFGGLAEIERTVAVAYDYGAILLFATVSAVLAFALFRRLLWPLLEAAACLILSLAAAFGLVFTIEFGHPGEELGFVAWPVALAAAYGLLRPLESRSPAWFNAVRPWAHAAAWWVLTLLIAWEASWQIQWRTGGVWYLLPWGLAPALAAWVAWRSLPLWPFAANRGAYRLHAAAPLVGFALLWVLGINLGHDGATDGLVYLPLLNPLDIAVALVLAGAVYYWLGLDDPERARLWSAPRRYLGAAIAGLVFIWLTAALLRSVHHLAAIPWDRDAMGESLLVQSSLSVFWGLLGITAIITASRRGWRMAWLAGAGLMAVVVVKLFAVDLTGTNTVARIVSFLTVGALLLLAGYFAPLPPKTSPSPRPTASTP